MTKSTLWISLLALVAFACNDTIPEPKNPFDQTKTSDTTTVVAALDSSSIVGLHKYIFQPKCAIPSCHGGTFEPDYRTPTSTYNTMVYADVIKNTDDFDFRYRAIPYDTAKSWLHYRLVTDDELLGRMPRYQPALTEQEMYYVNQWILDGCKDVNGKVATMPETNARVYGYAPVVNNMRIDTLRNWDKPFEVNRGASLDLYFYVYDNITDVFNLQGSLLKVSTEQNDFSNAVSISPVFYNSRPFWYTWKATINTLQYSSGTRLYLRYYVRDTFHTDLAEFPNDASPTWYINHYSLLVL